MLFFTRAAIQKKPLTTCCTGVSLSEYEIRSWCLGTKLIQIVVEIFFFFLLFLSRLCSIINVTTLCVFIFTYVG